MWTEFISRSEPRPRPEAMVVLGTLTVVATTASAGSTLSTSQHLALCKVV